MARISRCIVAIIAVILAISVFTTLSAGSSQTMPKPSVPEFTAEYVVRSYDVPVTYENITDPYTGEVRTRISGGNHIDNKTIDVIIANQPFSSTIIDGYSTYFYYIIRWKGTFDSWADINYSSWSFGSNDNQGHERIEPSDSDFTVKSYKLIWDLPYIPEGGSLDFQVKAQIGYSYPVYDGHIMPVGSVFKVEAESDWSNIQTVTISNESVSPSPSVPEFPYLTAIPLLLSALVVVLALRIRKPGYSRSN